MSAKKLPDTVTQREVAAEPRLLRAGQRQRYSIGYGGYGLVPALCALRLEHLLDAQTWLIEAAKCVLSIKSACIPLNTRASS